MTTSPGPVHLCLCGPHFVDVECDRPDCGYRDPPEPLSGPVDRLPPVDLWDFYRDDPAWQMRNLRRKRDPDKA
jgi:hypothetical protein